MDLDTALKEFATAFAAGPDNFGTIEYHSPAPIVEPFPLGSALADYYARLSMSDKPQVSGAMHLRLFKLDEIESRQHGWRWTRAKDGTVSESPSWSKDWILIADRDGDAIFVDTSSGKSEVWGSIMQRNFKIAEDIASFFQVMAEAVTVEAATFDYEVYDDDFNVCPQFRDAIRTIARRELGPDGEAGFMKFFFE